MSDSFPHLRVSHPRDFENGFVGGSHAVARVEVRIADPDLPSEDLQPAVTGRPELMPDELARLQIRPEDAGVLVNGRT